MQILPRKLAQFILKVTWEIVKDFQRKAYIETPRYNRVLKQLHPRTEITLWTVRSGIDIQGL